MPYWSGWNDTVQGYDGSRYSPTSGKEPGLIQRTEFQNGSYLILADEFMQWGKDADGNYTLDLYTCHDQSKVTTGSITANYTKQEDLTLTFAASEKDGWRYIEDTAVSKDKGVLWPAKVSTTAGSGTGVKAGFYVGLATSGVRASCSNNLNQVAIHAHTYGVYPEEIDGLKRDYEKLWGEVSKVLRELSELVAK